MQLRQFQLQKVGYTMMYSCVACLVDLEVKTPRRDLVADPVTAFPLGMGHLPHLRITNSRTDMYVRQVTI